MLRESRTKEKLGGGKGTGVGVGDGAGDWSQRRYDGFTLIQMFPLLLGGVIIIHGLLAFETFPRFALQIPTDMISAIGSTLVRHRRNGELVWQPLSRHAKVHVSEVPRALSIPLEITFGDVVRVMEAHHPELLRLNIVHIQRRSILFVNVYIDRLPTVVLRGLHGRPHESARQVWSNRKSKIQARDTLFATFCVLRRVERSMATFSSLLQHRLKLFREIL
mmetsp:Transcript_72294/g.188554  ORF Transcript_72294/g.188554 Transcript_72294/m.188554 type:complete len:220 (-) Transcript_72294:1148-1807(-)